RVDPNDRSAVDGKAWPHQADVDLDVRRLCELDGHFEVGHVGISEALGHRDEQRAAVRKGAERVGERIAAVDELKLADLRICIELQASDDLRPPQCRVIAEAALVEGQPASQAEMLEDLRFAADVERDKPLEADDRSSPPEQPRSLGDQRAATVYRPVS